MTLQSITNVTDTTESIAKQHAARLRNLTGVDTVSIEPGKEDGEVKLVVTPTDTLGKYSVEQHVHENEYGVFITVTDPK
jgi:LysM repeat protein